MEQTVQVELEKSKVTKDDDVLLARTRLKRNARVAELSFLAEQESHIGWQNQSAEQGNLLRGIVNCSDVAQSVD